MCSDVSSRTANRGSLDVDPCLVNAKFPECTSRLVNHEFQSWALVSGIGESVASLQVQDAFWIVEGSNLVVLEVSQEEP